MNKIIEKVLSEKTVFFGIEEIDGVISDADIVDDKDTLMSGRIRIIKYGAYVMVQETTDKGEAVLRLMKDLNHAVDFVNSRMDTYEKMWDGCGCRVKYYD